MNNDENTFSDFMEIVPYRQNQYQFYRIPEED